MTPQRQTSRVHWEGRAWRLRVVEHELPSGKVVESGVVEHPGSVVIVPILDDEVVLLRQYRVALDRSILELPAGTRGWEEDWLPCARRELREETGFRAQNWTSLGRIWPAPGMTDELMNVYLATGLEPAPLPADEDEVIEVGRRPLGELAEMAIDGRLQDAKSVVGILRAAAYLKAS